MDGSLLICSSSLMTSDPQDWIKPLHGKLTNKPPVYGTTSGSKMQQEKGATALKPPGLARVLNKNHPQLAFCFAPTCKRPFNSQEQ